LIGVGLLHMHTVREINPQVLQGSQAANSVCVTTIGK